MEHHSYFLYFVQLVRKLTVGESPAKSQDASIVRTEVSTDCRVTVKELSCITEDLKHFQSEHFLGI